MNEQKKMSELMTKLLPVYVKIDGHLILFVTVCLTDKNRF